MATVPELELPPFTPLTLVQADDASLAEAEALLAACRYAEACDVLEDAWDDVRHDIALAFRQRLALSWALLYRGALDEAERVLEHAAALVHQPQFDAADRAEVYFRQGCVALKQSHVADATALLTRAIEANERSPQPRISLSARAYEWRSRCHSFLRDFETARRDVDRAFELAAAARDDEATAHALFQASIVAERQSQWLLARCYAEQALDLYRRVGNRLCEARVLNNLGGIAFLLGDVEAAEASLLAAIETAADLDGDAELAQAVNSLAQVHLRTGRPAEARVHALRAVEMLAGRPDFVGELGNAQLVVAGALQAEGKLAAAAEWLDRAEETYVRLGSTSHLAAAWVARGDLARSQGDDDGAADLYRRAATTLQDVHF